MMPSKYRVHINFKNKRTYDVIRKGAERANTTPGKFAEQLIEKEINRPIMHNNNDDIDLKEAYYEITWVKLKDKLLRHRYCHSWHIYKDYTVEDFAHKFIRGKRISKQEVIKLIRHELVNLENYPASFFEPLADITLLLIKVMNVNVLDVKNRATNQENAKKKIRISFSYDANIIPVCLISDILSINILNIQHSTFKQIFEENKAYHFKKLFCVQITHSGGYFLMAARQPIHRSDVLQEINTQYPQKVKAFIDDENVILRNSSIQAKKLMLF